MLKVTATGCEETKRALPSERAVSVSIGGSSHAVMMVSPDDLEDFACGFLHSEGVISRATDIEQIIIVETPRGIDMQIRLAEHLGQSYQKSRRMMLGPVGCGLCGLEHIEASLPALDPVAPTQMDRDLPWRAMDALKRAQVKRAETGAMHGAALIDENANPLILREDIGRHNALDKVIGAALRRDLPLEGAILVTSSRVSIDLIIKAVRARASALIAKSSPSDLAVDYAKRWQLTLIAPVFESEYFQTEPISHKIKTETTQ